MGEVGRLSAGAKLRLAAEIVVTYGRVRWAMRREKLESVVARLRAAGGAEGEGEGESLSRAGRFQLAGAVGKLLSLLPTDSRCLVRSLVLLALLERRGVAGTLVIGVCTEPEFAAHAWIECEGDELLPSGAGKFAPLTRL